MNLQFAIDEGHCLSKEHFNTGFRKYCGEIPTVCKDNFNKHPIEIVSVSITNEVATDLENQHNLSDSLAVLDKATQL